MGELAKGLRAPLDIGTTAVLAENKSPMLTMETRHSYFMKHFDVWKDYLRYKAYFMILAVLTVAFIFTQPLFAIIGAFATAYCYQISSFCKGRTLGNQRTVMIGH